MVHRSGRWGYGAAVLIAGLMFVLELVASFWTNSQALWGDAWHVLGDSVPLCLGWYAARAHQHGKNTTRIEYATTVTNILFLFVVGIVVGVGGGYRFLYPEPVLAEQTIFFAMAGAMGNYFQIKISQNLGGLHQHAHTAKGQTAHFVSDFFSSVAVIAGALLTGLGLLWGDGVAAMVVAGFIMHLARNLYLDLRHEH